VLNWEEWKHPGRSVQIACGGVVETAARSAVFW
jgi:hypothetical protein